NEETVKMRIHTRHHRRRESKHCRRLCEPISIISCRYRRSFRLQRLFLTLPRRHTLRFLQTGVPSDRVATCPLPTDPPFSLRWITPLFCQCLQLRILSEVGQELGDSNAPDIKLSRLLNRVKHV